MERVVFFGTCQAQSLCNIYNNHIISDNQARSSYISANLDFRPDTIAQLTQADLIVNQLYTGEQRATLPRADLRAKVIDFPFIAGLFLWPYASEEHANRRHFKLTRMSPYDAEMGDSYLNRLLRKGGEVDVEAAVERYVALDIVAAAHVARRAEIIFHQQRTRDEATGIRMLDFIESNLQDVDLFMTRGHPSLPMIRHLAEQVFGLMNVAPSLIERMKSTLIRVPDHTNEAAIHPAVATHFGLRHAGVDRRYAQFGGRYDFAECCRRYLRYEWNQKLMEGMWFADAEPEKAVELLTEGLQTEPRSASALNAFGRVLMRLGRQEEALQALQSAWHLDPRNPHFAIHYSNALSHAGGLMQAEEVLRDALSRFPNWPELNVTLSHLLSKTQRLPAAVAAAEFAARFSSRQRAILPHLGRLLLNDGQIARGLDIFHEAIRLNPDDAAARASLANALLLAKRPEPALEECRCAIALAPQEARYLALAAEILNGMERFEEAEAAYLELLRADPENLQAHVALVHLLARRNDPAGAVARGRAAVAMRPDDASLMVYIGEQLALSGLPEPAAALFVDALMLEPRRAHTHLLLSRALAQQHRFDEAIYAAINAAGLEPENAGLSTRLQTLVAQRCRAQEARSTAGATAGAAQAA